MSIDSNNIDSSLLKSMPEAEFPSHLHGQIMKKVFFAGYGRYLYLSTGVLFLNLAVLARELWRTAVEIESSNEFIHGLAVLPWHVFATLGLTAFATAYAFHMIWNLYKEYRVFAFAGSKA